MFDVLIKMILVVSLYENNVTPITTCHLNKL